MKNKYEDLSADGKEMMDSLLDLVSILKNTSNKFSTSYKSFNIIALLLPINNILIKEDEEREYYKKEAVPSTVVIIHDKEKETIVNGLYSLFTSDKMLLDILLNVSEKISKNKHEILEKFNV